MLNIIIVNLAYLGEKGCKEEEGNLVQQKSNFSSVHLFVSIHMEKSSDKCLRWCTGTYRPSPALHFPPSIPWRKFQTHVLVDTVVSLFPLPRNSRQSLTSTLVVFLSLHSHGKDLTLTCLHSCYRPFTWKRSQTITHHHSCCLPFPPLPWKRTRHSLISIFSAFLSLPSHGKELRESIISSLDVFPFLPCSWK